MKNKMPMTLLLGVAGLAAFTLAYAAATKMPGKIKIESKDVFTTMKMPPVFFDPAKHKDIKCTVCHHDFKDGKNVWKEGDEVKKCSTCHKLESKGKVEKLEKAYHDRCVGCHKKRKKEKKNAGPTSCSKCHQKKEGAQK